MSDDKKRSPRVTESLVLLGELISDSLTKLTTMEITEFWNRLFHIAMSKSLDGQEMYETLTKIADRAAEKRDLRASVPSRASKYNDQTVDYAISIVEEITEMYESGECNWDSAEDVTARAQDMGQTISKSGRVTQKQVQALENMREGMRKWMRQDDDEIPF